jgi:hypothetical protein
MADGVNGLHGDRVQSHVASACKEGTDRVQSLTQLYLATIVLVIPEIIEYAYLELVQVLI